jgi:cyanate lyase
MEQRIKLAILSDHNEAGLSYRTLAEKYGISRIYVHRLVMSKGKKRKAPEVITRVIQEEMVLPDDPVLLKEQLRQALLKIELQDFMLDISSKELGMDLRKKHGTRRSK